MSEHVYCIKKPKLSGRKKKRATRIFTAVLKAVNNRMASSLVFLANRFTSFRFRKVVFLI
jgi:hypothetical protein